MKNTNKKWIVLILTLSVNVASFAQLSVEECYEKAKANYPLIKQYELLKRARDYNLSNVGKMWLPQIQLAAKATYQSDVTEIPIDFSQVPIPQPANIEIPSVSKDQYGITLEISQTLWDGGTSGAKRKTINAQSDVNEKELEVNLYAMRERVNQLYFGVLLCDAMTEQAKLFQEELDRNYNRVSALMQSGLANQADLDAVKVEQLKVAQRVTQIAYGRKAFLDMLSAFIGEKIDDSKTLNKPSADYQPSTTSARPELKLFDARKTTMEATKKELNTSLSPRIGVFLTGGYGKPGLNMLKNEFSAYYIAGVRLLWNIGAFYTRKNSLRLLETGSNAIETQRETFLFNMALSQTGKENEINKYRELLQSDDEIITLRNSIKQSSEAKLQNGTTTATDLMRDANAEQQARQDKIVHEIEMLQAIYNLKFIVNK
jgi:outer membrane protein TolC